MPTTKKPTTTKRVSTRQKAVPFSPNWRIILLGAAVVLALILALLTAYGSGWDARGDNIRTTQTTKAK